MTHDRMKLAAFLYPTGYHVAAWRHPDVPPDCGINFGAYRSMACKAEHGLFDFIFLADNAATKGNDLPALSRTAIRYVAQFEPFTLLSALAAVTNRVGLVASATTTYNEPFHIARKFASLDHLSGGRAGWNVVTSSNEDEAYNFGLEFHPKHADRYARAAEFVDVVKGLWDTWEDDAFVRDQVEGRFFDPDKLHILGHNQHYFRVRGPLNIPRPPQGYPVIVQSGSSDAGKDLAARTAEIIFTAQPTLSGALAFCKELRDRAARYGRSGQNFKVMPGIFPFVGRTRWEAEDKFQKLQSLIDPVVGLSLLEGLLPGLKLSPASLDEPIPELPPSNGHMSRQALLVEIARRENLTVRQLYLRVAGSRGHWQVIGSAIEIADAMEEWFTADAADGFNVMPPMLPSGLDDFVELVVPELQRRQLFRTQYDGNTLRENLGLPRPDHPAGQKKCET